MDTEKDCKWLSFLISGCGTVFNFYVAFTGWANFEYNILKFSSLKVFEKFMIVKMFLFFFC